MSDPLAPRILLAALLSLLIESLDRDETRHLTNDQLNSELSAMQTRLERELESLSGVRRLRLAGLDASMSED